MRRIILALTLLLAAGFGLRSTPAQAAPPPACSFVGAMPATLVVPQGTPVLYRVLVYCPGNATMTVSAHVNGAAMNYTLAQNIPLTAYAPPFMPLTVTGVGLATFALPTSILPPGQYSVFAEAGGTRSQVSIFIVQ